MVCAKKRTFAGQVYLPLLTHNIFPSSNKDSGLHEIWEKVLNYKDHAEGTDFFANKRKKQALSWMKETIDESLRTHFHGDVVIQKRLESLREDVLKDKITSFAAAQQILDEYFRSEK